MKQFIVKVKHDKGIIKIQTAADDAQAAHKIICAAEGCPDCAILSVTELTQAPETHTATRSTQHIHLVHCDVTVNYNGREIAGKITDTTDAENGLYISILPNAAQDADVIGVWLPLRGAKLSHELPIFPPHQMDMFIDTGRVDDLPLFSNTPQRVPASHFDPPTVSKAKQTKLF